MASSGVEATQNCYDAFNEMKTKKEHAFLIFVIEKGDKERIELTYKSGADETFEDLREQMDTNFKEKPCYIILDFLKDVNKSGRIVHLAWNPEKGKVREKMLIASSKKSFAKIGKESKVYQIDDFSDFTIEHINSMLPKSLLTNQ